MGFWEGEGDGLVGGWNVYLDSYVDGGGDVLGGYGGGVWGVDGDDLVAGDVVFCACCDLEDVVVCHLCFCRFEVGSVFV